MKARRDPAQGAEPEQDVGEDAGRGTQVIEEIAAEFSTEELLEFLEASQHPVDADPAFRERLREELWALVRRQVESKG